MNVETIASIVFVVLLTVFLFAKRKKLDTKFLIPYFLYFSMYRTKLGLKLMDSLANQFRKLVKFIGYLGIIVGFLGMILIAFSLFQNLFQLFTKPEAAQGVGLVLPIQGKGIFYVPFFYWIIAIFVIAVVHEFSHGLVARAHNLKVKSSGFAFLGLIVPIIPAAFVEPDEKELRKRPHREQLSVFAAGPLANIITAFVFILIMVFALSPLAGSLVEADGVKITDYVKGNITFPAEKAGIGKGEIIKEVDNRSIKSLTNLSDAFRAKKPGDLVTIKTNSSAYQLRLAGNPDNSSAAFMGTTLEESAKIKDNIKEKYGEFIPSAVIWVHGLFVILIVLNFGIGLFNLAPIGPLDGGRMLQLPLQRYFGKDKGNKILAYISLVFFLIIIVILVAPFGLLNFLK